MAGAEFRGVSCALNADMALRISDPVGVSALEKVGAQLLKVEVLAHGLFAITARATLQISAPLGIQALL